MGKRALAVLGGRGLRLVFPEQLDVTAERHGGDQVLRLPHLAPQQLRAEAKRKLQHLHADPTRCQEMTQLVEGDEDSQHDEESPSRLDEDPKGIGGPGKCGQRHIFGLESKILKRYSTIDPAQFKMKSQCDRACTNDSALARAHRSVSKASS